tara:strand:+ start:351 stop:869 length:519 start_codon:yes stop_codon:yes gene_type:complete
MKIFKDVRGYEGLYKACSDGHIISFNRKEPFILSAAEDRGYLKIVLCKNKIRRTVRVHRIIAEAFLNNPENKPEVNHINGDKLDNSVDNLEWCTRLENAKHALDNGLYGRIVMTNKHKKILKEKNSKAVICTVTGAEWDSASGAADSLGIAKSTMVHFLLGTRKNKTNLKYK